jgi:hypothetical protein
MLASMKKQLVLLVMLVGSLNSFAQLPEDKTFVVSVQRMTIEEGSDRPVVRTCATVFTDGSFRFEKVSQFLDRTYTADFWVYKGKLTESQLGELNNILADPKIATRPDSPPKGGLAFVEGEFTDIWVGRHERVQYFSLKSVFGVKADDPRWRANRISLQQIDDKEFAKDLFRFMKDILEKNKGKSLKGTPAQCAPPAGGDDLKRPPISR